MSVGIPLPELDVTKPAQNPPPDALAEFQRAAQLQTAAAQQQAIQANTEGQQQQNQAQALQLKDEQLRRQLAPQFVQKDENGKPVGFDTEGLYNAMLQGGADPMTINAMRMKQVEMQKALLGLSDAALDHQQKLNGVIVDGIESVRDANDKALTKANAGATPVPAAQGQAPNPLGNAVPGTGGMPSGMLPNIPQAQVPIGKAQPGSPESLGAQPDGQQPTATESALQDASKGPQPITPEAQAAYQQFLVRAARMGIPVGQFKPTLTDTSDLDQAEAGAGLHAELLKQQKAQADIAEAAGKGAQAQSEAEAALWKPAGEGTLVNVKTGQLIHGVASPNVEAFRQFVADGGQPDQFAAHQAQQDAAARLPYQVQAEIDKQVAMQKLNPAAVATVQPHLVAPATAAFAKAGEEYATAYQASQNMMDFLNEAKGGNKEAVKIVPLQGALEITTAQGVHRINRTEVDQFGAAGSLYDKLAGAVGGVMTGKNISDAVLKDMGDLQQTVATNAAQLHANKVQTINQTYGSKSQPMNFGQGHPTPNSAPAKFKVGDSVMYNGAPHKVTSVDPNTGKLTLAP